MTATTICPSWCQRHGGGNPDYIHHSRRVLDADTPSSSAHVALGWAQPRPGTVSAAFLDKVLHPAAPQGYVRPGPHKAASVAGSDLDAEQCRQLAAALLQAADLLDQA